MIDLKSIIPIIHSNSGCDFHRCITPLEYLGVDLEYFKDKKISDVIENAKLVFFNRTPTMELSQLLDLQKKYNFKICVDLDDFPFVNVAHPMYAGWKYNQIGEKIVECLKVANAVITTTPRLADKLKQYTSSPIYVIPNSLPFGEGQFNDQKELSDKMNFMYTGGVTHFWDIRELKIAFQKANNNPLFAAQAEFTMCGFHDDGAQSTQEWLKLERAFNLNGKLRGYVRRYTLPLTEYMNHYKYANVSLIPLEYNSFSPYKSNLKIIEAGCKHIPCIASYTPPYSDELLVDPNAPLIFANSPREWYEHLLYCVKNPNFVVEKGQELGTYVRKYYDLLKINEYRKQLFESLMS